MGKDEIEQNARDQGMEITNSLLTAGAFISPGRTSTQDQLRNQLADSKVVALIAYLQKLGAYQVVEPTAVKEGRPLDPDSYRHAAETPVKSEAKN